MKMEKRRKVGEEVGKKVYFGHVKFEVPTGHLKEAVSKGHLVM